MDNNKKVLLKSYSEKCHKSIALLEASYSKVGTFDENKHYTYDELEPYDALSERFVRAVEVIIKFLRAYHLYNEGINTETLRDLLNYSEKTLFISSTDLWLEIRDIRNRMVHDYLPEQQKLLFDDIIGHFKNEIRTFHKRLSMLNID